MSTEPLAILLAEDDIGHATLVRRNLQRAGVEMIEIAGLCTAERTDEWFSHRAEKGRTGRFGAVLCLS